MIAVLISTYNGEKYISEQIESILHQSKQDFKIYVRDDGSTDSTISILKQYTDNYPQMIQLLNDVVKHRGPSQSFLWLLSNVGSEYYMFSDQDDVWLPNKIKISYEAIVREEKKNTNIPILVHTDMKIVNENLELISGSLYRTMNIKTKIIDNSFNFMGVCSCGPGCSMLFNRKARDISIAYDDLSDTPMHDWWVAINTLKKGRVVFVPTPTMLYRQHQSNTVGASNVDLIYLINKVINLRQTLSPYTQDMVWLRKVGYGSMAKYLFFKLAYYIIRLF